MRTRLPAALMSLAVASVWLSAAGSALALANPAAVYCEQRGGRVEVETTANGAEKGSCVLQNGTRIDEWAYFRNTHRTTH